MIIFHALLVLMKSCLFLEFLCENRIWLFRFLFCLCIFCFDTFLFLHFSPNFEHDCDGRCCKVSFSWSYIWYFVLKAECCDIPIRLKNWVGWERKWTIQPRILHSTLVQSREKSNLSLQYPILQACVLLNELPDILASSGQSQNIRYTQKGC